MGKTNGDEHSSESEGVKLSIDLQTLRNTWLQNINYLYIICMVETEQFSSVAWSKH